MLEMSLGLLGGFGQGSRGYCDEVSLSRRQRNEVLGIQLDQLLPIEPRLFRQDFVRLGTRHIPRRE